MPRSAETRLRYIAADSKRKLELPQRRAAALVEATAVVIDAASASLSTSADAESAANPTLSVEQTTAILTNGPLGPFLQSLLDAKRVRVHPAIKVWSSPGGVSAARVQGITTADGTIHLVAGNPPTP